MEIRSCAYYNDFRCLAGSCPDSCCKEWAVVIDPDAQQRYRALDSALGQALRDAMVEEDGDTILTLTPDGRCPMWRQDGLCRIQAQLGEEGLCQTCHQFPRLRHDYGDFAELGLELSCPEAARLILSGDNVRSVITKAPGGDAPEYDPEAMDILLRSRAQILAFLEDPAYTVGQALAVMLLYGYAVQEELDSGSVADLAPATMLAEAEKLAVPGDMGAVLDFYQTLEILSPAWKERLMAPLGSGWSAQLRAMAQYFINRYWLQAVSDYDLVGRVKFAAVSCLVVKALGGDVYATAQRYSKEIENDADNVDAILDAAYTSPALADIRLLGLLLEDETWKNDC